MFSQISINWAGQPLCTLETMLGYMGNTTTTTGLKVTASLIEGIYETGKKVSDAVMERLNLERHSICPQSNYTIRPRMDGAFMT